MTQELREKKKQALRPPDFYALVFHNDDYTPMVFVVDVLQKRVGLTEEHAVTTAIEVHEKGSAKVGRWTKDVAVSIAVLVTDDARRHDHPLQVSVEPV